MSSVDIGRHIIQKRDRTTTAVYHRHQKWRYNEKRKPFDIAQEHRRTQATDPQYKIYGLVGLLTGLLKESFEIDYSKPAHEVYRGIAEYYIKKGLVAKIWAQQANLEQF